MTSRFLLPCFAFAGLVIAAACGSPVSESETTDDGGAEGGGGGAASSSGSSGGGNGTTPPPPPPPSQEGGDPSCTTGGYHAVVDLADATTMGAALYSIGKTDGDHDAFVARVHDSGGSPIHGFQGLASDATKLYGLVGNGSSDAVFLTIDKATGLAAVLGATPPGFPKQSTSLSAPVANRLLVASGMTIMCVDFSMNDFVTVATGADTGSLYIYGIRGTCALDGTFDFEAVVNADAGGAGMKLVQLQKTSAGGTVFEAYASAESSGIPEGIANGHLALLQNHELQLATSGGWSKIRTLDAAPCGGPVYAGTGFFFAE